MGWFALGWGAFSSPFLIHEITAISLSKANGGKTLRLGTGKIKWMRCYGNQASSWQFYELTLLFFLKKYFVSLILYHPTKNVLLSQTDFVTYSNSNLVFFNLKNLTIYCKTPLQSILLTSLCI